MALIPLFELDEAQRRHDSLAWPAVLEPPQRVFSPLSGQFSRSFRAPLPSPDRCALCATNLNVARKALSGPESPTLPEGECFPYYLAHVFDRTELFRTAD